MPLNCLNPADHKTRSRTRGLLQTQVRLAVMKTLRPGHNQIDGMPHIAGAKRRRDTRRRVHLLPGELQRRPHSG